VRAWLLPEYIEDILPPEARRVESLRARLLELFRVHGYQLVMPPMLEYVESLLTGTGHDLDLRTFKLVDQLSGRMMGVRADITPQVAQRHTRAAADRCRGLRPSGHRKRPRDPGSAAQGARCLRHSGRPP